MAKNTDFRPKRSRPLFVSGRFSVGIKYLELTKPKVTLLNMFVGVTCFLLAEIPSVNWELLAFFVAISYLSVGGSCVLNNYFDRDLDSAMERTSKRALPSGMVSPRRAAALGLLMLSAGLSIACLIFGYLSTFIVFSGISVYVVVYTMWLKRYTRWGVIVGGISGSLAAVFGWVATGSVFALVPLIVALLDFFWTPGHLWGYAIKNVADYSGAGVPMLPVVVGSARSSKYILAFNATTIGLSFLFPILGIAGLLYTTVAAVTGFVLLRESLRLVKTPTHEQAFRVFFASMPYLALIMLALLADKLLYVSLAL